MRLLGWFFSLDSCLLVAKNWNDSPRQLKLGGFIKQAACSPPSRHESRWSPVGLVSSVFFLIYNFIYYFLLLLVVLGLCCCVGFLSSCHMWASHCGDFPCWGAWAPGHTGFSGLSDCGSRALEHRLTKLCCTQLSCPTACGIFPDQGLNPCLLHWQADPLPLSHQRTALLSSVLRTKWKQPEELYSLLCLHQVAPQDLAGRVWGVLHCTS